MTEVIQQKIDVPALFLSLLAAGATAYGIFTGLEALPQDERLLAAGLGGFIAGVSTSVAYGYFYGFKW